MASARPSSPCHCSTLRRASRALTALYDRALEPAQLTLPQFSLLRRIQRAGPASLTRLAQVVQLERTTLGRNLRPLEEAGLVESRASETDARERVIALTPAGVQALDAAVPLWRKAQGKVEQHLGAQRLAQLRELLDDLEALAA